MLRDLLPQLWVGISLVLAAHCDQDVGSAPSQADGSEDTSLISCVMLSIPGRRSPSSPLFCLDLSQERTGEPAEFTVRLNLRYF